MCGFLMTSDKTIGDSTFKKALELINHRGPDDTEFVPTEGGIFGFKRLAIMDLTHAGDQPFANNGLTIMCNGEIYNYEKIKAEMPYEYKSKSDCEVLMPLYQKGGIELIVQSLDSEYALVGYDHKTSSLFAARDPIGIRPLFYGYTDEGKISFASEVKALQSFCTDIKAFPPGHFYKDGKIIQYKSLTNIKKFSTDSLDDVLVNIKSKLVEGVRKRLQSDAPIGFLLSGGLDSSLVCSIAQRLSDEPIKTFAIGMEDDAIDLKYAKQVADHIGSDHTEVIIDKEDVLSCLRDVVFHLETWDITTIRASVGMYLICKYIHEKTDVKVLMTGEVSDEIFGYKYTDFAPSPEEFQKEAAKRVDELYIYDVLRADRCISAHSIEARVPFSDTDFVDYVMSIDPKLKMNTYGHGKYLLRAAFLDDDYLPESLLFREKAAFSDAVGHSLVDYLKEFAETEVSSEDLEAARFKYKHSTPFTKESLMYRNLFQEFYPSMCELIKDYWMPNKEWENCDVKDPSARVLPNYGQSGS